MAEPAIASDMSSLIEKEFSYSINLSQDLLYIILSSYIFKKFVCTEEYLECTDVNNVRTRLTTTASGTGVVKIESIVKTLQKSNRIVHVSRLGLLPLIERTNIETTVSNNKINSDGDDSSSNKNADNKIRPSERLKRIVNCRVYRTEKRPEIEIKFERIYFNQSAGDKFDSLQANKQTVLLNLLRNTNERVSSNSHLGSDEIFVALRLEYEYTDSADGNVLDYMVKIVANMEKFAKRQNISPLIAYTTLQNSVIYRKFEAESKICGNTSNDDDDDNEETSVLKWAVKLDGVRGKGLFTRESVVVFMDDMQIFSGRLPVLFSTNNVVAFQCELVDKKTLYVTDLLHVFKYDYNNRTQYECSSEAHTIDPVAAINCINDLADKHPSGLKFVNDDNKDDNNNLVVKFQRFFDPPLLITGYCSMPTDGFVVLNRRMQYVKRKHIKTMELEYDSVLDKLCTLNGPLSDEYVVENNNALTLQHGSIYECAFGDNGSTVISIIKLRRDRFVPQMIM